MLLDVDTFFFCCGLRNGVVGVIPIWALRTNELDVFMRSSYMRYCGNRAWKWKMNEIRWNNGNLIDYSQQYGMKEKICVIRLHTTFGWHAIRLAGRTLSVQHRMRQAQSPSLGCYKYVQYYTYIYAYISHFYWEFERWQNENHKINIFVLKSWRNITIELNKESFSVYCHLGGWWSYDCVLCFWLFYYE